MQYYKITWTDHFPLPEWSLKEDIEKWALEKKGQHCVTVGVITYEDKDVVVISASFDGDENYGDSLAIAKVDIVKRKKIKV